ncbi:MAG TPA: dihydrodipicolinate synthase family protein [Spirochaetia bacterium]|nr:dihydrodipicolinate synthase family protein [Spirochaetia bacterium]
MNTKTQKAGAPGQSPFRGVFSLLLTPFREDKSIDWDSYEQYVEWQIGTGPQGLFAVCGSSEMKWLTEAERIELARRAVKIAGDLPVAATANLLPDLSQHRDEIRRMADTGVAAVVLVPPSGLGSDQKRLGDYFARLLDESPIPGLIYEWPMVSPYLIDAPVFGDLAHKHGLAGIKDTTCTMEGIGGKIAAAGNATVFQANAPFMLDSIRNGAQGVMAIVTTAASDLATGFWRRASAGDYEGAAPLHEQLVMLDSTLERGGCYPATAKHLCTRRGVRMTLACRNPAPVRAESLKAVEVWYAAARRSGALVENAIRNP